MATSLQQFNELAESQATAMVAALPKGHNVDRVFRTAAMIIMATPKLAACSASSLFMSAAACALMGLEMSTEMGEAYLVPFKGVCTLMPSYKGMVKLAVQHRDVMGITVRVVRADDVIQIQDGSVRTITHDYDPFATNAERGDTVGVYSIYETIQGFTDFEFMNMDDLNACKRVSKTPDVWKSWPGEMQKKSVLKRLTKRMPRTIEANQAIAYDNAAESGIPQDRSIIIPKGIEEAVGKEHPTPTQIAASLAETLGLDNEDAEPFKNT